MYLPQINLPLMSHEAKLFALKQIKEAFEQTNSGPLGKLICPLNQIHLLSQPYTWLPEPKYLCPLNQTRSLGFGRDPNRGPKRTLQLTLSLSKLKKVLKPNP